MGSHRTAVDAYTNESGVIEKEVFLGMSKLTKLQLAKNQLTWLEPGCFDPLVSLQNLNLGVNNFAGQIGNATSGQLVATSPEPWDLFKKLVSLTSLHVSSTLSDSQVNRVCGACYIDGKLGRYGVPPHRCRCIHE